MFFEKPKPKPEPEQPKNEITLEQQELVNRFAAILTSEVEKSKDQERQNRAQQAIDAKTKCVPKKSFGLKDGSLDFEFLNELKIADATNLLEEVKASGSI